MKNGDEELGGGARTEEMGVAVRNWSILYIKKEWASQISNVPMYLQKIARSLYALLVHFILIGMCSPTLQTSRLNDFTTGRRLFFWAFACTFYSLLCSNIYKDTIKAVSFSGE